MATKDPLVVVTALVVDSEPLGAMHSVGVVCLYAEQGAAVSSLVNAAPRLLAANGWHRSARAPLPSRLLPLPMLRMIRHRRVLVELALLVHPVVHLPVR